MTTQKPKRERIFTWRNVTQGVLLGLLGIAFLMFLEVMNVPKC